MGRVPAQCPRRDDLSPASCSRNRRGLVWHPGGAARSGRDPARASALRAQSPIAAHGSGRWANTAFPRVDTGWRACSAAQGRTCSFAGDSRGRVPSPISGVAFPSPGAVLHWPRPLALLSLAGQAGRDSRNPLARGGWTIPTVSLWWRSGRTAPTSTTPTGRSGSRQGCAALTNPCSLATGTLNRHSARFKAAALNRL